MFKLFDGDVATRRHLNRDIIPRFVSKPIRPRLENRLDGHCRLVVEQDDQLFADVNEGDFFVGNCREIDLDFLVVAEIDHHRLIGQRLGQFVYSYGGCGRCSKWKCRQPEQPEKDRSYF